MPNPDETDLTSRRSQWIRKRAESDAASTMDEERGRLMDRAISVLHDHPRSRRKAVEEGAKGEAAGRDGAKGEAGAE